MIEISIGFPPNPEEGENRLNAVLCQRIYIETMDQSMSRDRTLDLLRVTSYGPVIGFEDSLPWSERSEKSIGTKGCLTPVRKWLGM